MLISHSRRFIYVHVNRAGGSSFAKALQPLLHEQPRGTGAKLLNKLGLERDPMKMRFRAHDTALDVKKRWPAAMFDEYYKFAFVRNPYTWMVSMYARVMGTPTHRHHERVTKMSGYPEYIDFEIARNARHQYPFVTDERDSIIVDFVGRFEKLQEGFAHVCEHLSLGSVELPHVGSRKRKDWREYYDDATREKVARHWRKDFELFEYEA